MVYLCGAVGKAMSTLCTIARYTIFDQERLHLNFICVFCFGAAHVNISNKSSRRDRASIGRRRAEQHLVVRYTGQ